MNQHKFFYAAEILKNWAEIHQNQIRIHNVEIETEDTIQVWVNILGEKVDRRIRINSDDTLSIIQTIEHDGYKQTKGYMVI